MFQALFHLDAKEHNIYQLSYLLLSDCTALTDLCFGGCDISSGSLWFENCSAIKNFSCGPNPLGSLDVSELTELVDLECGNSELESLDLSNNKKLKNVECGDNDFDEDDLNNLFESLHEIEIKDKWISFIHNPGFEDCDLSIIEKKGWTYDQ